MPAELFRVKLNHRNAGFNYKITGGIKVHHYTYFILNMHYIYSNEFKATLKTYICTLSKKNNKVFIYLDINNLNFIPVIVVYHLIHFVNSQTI